MAHPNKVKGSAAERAVAQFLRENGYPYAERTRAGWTDDRGDIDGLPGVCIEVKNEKRIDLPQYLRELAREMENAKADTGVVIVKRRGVADAGQWYAVLPVALWVDLIKETGR